ncbi:MAG TPA: helix-turn-helix domain-containing protein [Terriglobia bacterium]|nr:helix-turn-helix domain-containing protein [Terriglobia bacterium]
MSSGKFKVGEFEGGLLDTEHAAEFVGLSPATLKWWRTRNRKCGPPYFRLHKNAIRYSRADLEVWLRERRVRNEVLNG